MIYSFAFCCLAIYSLSFALLSYFSRKPHPIILAKRVWVGFIVCFMVAAPINLSIVTATPSAMGLKLTRYANLSVVLSSIGAVILAGVVCRRIYLDYRSSSTVGFWRVGGRVAVLVSAMVLVVAGIKHVTFATAEAGWTQAKSIPGLECDKPIVLFQWAGLERGADPSLAAFTPARYRCPGALLFNQWSQVPFAPWPDYVEGESIELARELNEIVSSAQKK